MSRKQIANIVMSKILMLTDKEIEENFQNFLPTEKEELAKITLIDIVKAIKENPEYFQQLENKYDIIYHAWVIKSVEKSKDDIKKGRFMTLQEAEEKFEGWIRDNYEDNNKQ